MDDLSGQRVKDYELRELIGEGGFGAVYRAFQPLIGREVAIKIILPELANHPDFIRRFEAEAQLVARLEHPHIVPLYDYWREPNSAYLIMRWLRGGSLHAALEESGAWDPESVSRLLDQIGMALAIAHRHGVVHRDVKPGNILLDEDQNAYLADFGIAKDLHSQLAADENEQLVGSPAYFSPEQIKSQPVTPQSDIYSLGLLLYELLTGTPPYHDAATTAELIFKHLQDPLPSVRHLRADLPVALDAVLARATEKEPAQRYPDVLTLVGAFRQAVRVLDTPHRVVSEGHSLAAVDLSHKNDTLVLGADLLEPENPYKGLRAFQEADAADFFGRQALVAQLLKRLREPETNARFLAVVGPSGSGKSSVVKAGLLPELRQGALSDSAHWYLVEMVPGSSPLRELETALRRIAVNLPASLSMTLSRDESGLLTAIKQTLPDDDSQLFLFIDQFEEVFTQVEDEAERAHFLNSLITAISSPESRMMLMITLRADFYDRPLLYPQMGELMRQRTEVVLPLSRSELEQAITAPAERVGVHLESGLIDAIGEDVAEQPGALPLLQYALTELFERREGRRLTLKAYRDSGGVLGALATRADELYSSLDEGGQEAARQLFLRLITLGEGTEDTRRRVRQSELLSIAGGIQAVMDVYARHRLLTFDRDPATRAPTVDVAHEALIQRWGQLREWLEASRDDLRLQRRLTTAAFEWMQSGQERSFLASGVRLVQFENLVAAPNLVLNQEETAYVKASIRERETQQALEDARKAREEQLEQRERRWLQILVMVLLLAVVGALVLTAAALNERQAAENNAQQAQTLALSSGSQLALNNNNTELALALALAANRRDNPPSLARRALYEAAYAPGIIRYFTGHTQRVNSVAFSPDGRRALSGSADGNLILWDVDTGQVIRTLAGHRDWVRAVAFSPDGHAAVSASDDKTLIFWDVETGKVSRQLKTGESEVTSVAFSPDGRQIVSGLEDKTIALWSAADGALVRRLTGHTQRVNGAVFSPDGQTILSAASDETLILWDVNTGEAIRYLEGHSGPVLAAAFSPDGRNALSGSDDRTLILWDVQAGAILRQFEGHTDQVLSVAFSPDGRLAVSSSYDNKVILWNLEAREPLHTFEAHNGPVYSVAFSPNGRWVLSGSYDANLILWDLQNGALAEQLRGHTDWTNDVAFSPDGKTMLSVSSDMTLRLWDRVSGQAIRRLEGHHAPVWTAAFSPDGKTILSGSDDATLILWDVAGGALIRQFKGHSDWVNDVTFSLDGRTALSASGDNTLILWDVATGVPIRRYVGHKGAATAVAFMAGGRQAISGSYDGSVIIWDVETAAIVQQFEQVADWISSLSVSPDERTVLVGSTEVILYDLAQGQTIRRMTNHTGPINAVAFSPDGRTAISGAADNTLIWWNIETGEAINRLREHTGPVTNMAFSPDGRNILSASQDRMILMWRIDSLNELVSWTLANRYVRELTCTEREQYQLTPACDAGGIYPTRTPYATLFPTSGALATPGADLTRTAAPVATTTLTVTPLPPPTQTPVPLPAAPGQNRGELVKGDWNTWRYEGRAGEVLTLGVYADKPANDFSGPERERRGLLDTLLIVRSPTDTVLAEADDIDDGVTDSLVEGLELPETGTYIIEVRSYGDQMAGPYTLVVESQLP